jgi:hypothetical protein
MPMEFLTDDEAAFGRYTGPPTRARLDRMFYLDDADLKLIAKSRFDRLLATARCLRLPPRSGTWLARGAPNFDPPATHQEVRACEDGGAD